jgi:hypothetical protein
MYLIVPGFRCFATANTLPGSIDVLIKFSAVVVSGTMFESVRRNRNMHEELNVMSLGLKRKEYIMLPANVFYSIIVASHSCAKSQD